MFQEVVGLRSSMSASGIGLRRCCQMHRGALAALVDSGLNSDCLGKIRMNEGPLRMPQKVIQRLKSEGIILRSDRYNKKYYAWRPGPKYDHFLEQLLDMEGRMQG